MAYTKPQQRRKDESERLRERREIGSSLFILDVKDGRLDDSGKQEDGKMFHNAVVCSISSGNCWQDSNS